VEPIQEVKNKRCDYQKDKDRHFSTVSLHAGSGEIG
jgi:hypothetical protein